MGAIKRALIPGNLRAQMIIARLRPWIPDLAYRDIVQDLHACRVVLAGQAAAVARAAHSRAYERRRAVLDSLKMPHSIHLLLDIAPAY